MSVNKLILGDNLEILKAMESETVDLIYLDPPFFSNRNYEVIWGDEGEVRSFQDRWAGGIDHYITWLKERVAEMHRVLKPIGSIYLHCDWHADAYIRVEILDRLFGMNNMVNHLIWCYDTGGRSNNFFPKKHDSIFWYAKNIKQKIFNDNEIRTFRDTSTMHEPVLKDAKGKSYQRNFKNGKEYRYYLDKGVIPNDYWIDIQALNPAAKERIGYPTQKPEALMERIIKCSSNEGDVVLDPFVGGGTTVAVADKLNRKWIGIDQSVQAIKVTELRLDKQRGLFSAPFTVQLHKYDYDTLRYANAFEFESWIIQQFGGVSNAKQRGDLGLDGKMPDNTPIQVKRSDNIGRNVIDNFFAAVQRSDKKLFAKNVANKKPVGYIIAFSFGKGAVEEVARLKLKENVAIELVTADKIVPIAKKPTITVEINELSRDAKGVREIELIAVGQSEAGVEFYTWDFEYNAEQGFRASIIMDREGRQLAKLKAGRHNIAVKVVDNDGLEGVEVIKLKVNGAVKVE
ncbi:MAG: site-specific DNA-methyltransferase [Prevotellaceae bacterium]|jgi:DNA modification methylase|nr:site-specific DNA-methyltransferase [Prevotellaceae bacterium]